MYEKYFNKLREECLIRNRSSRTADTYINNIRHFMKWTGYKSMEDFFSSPSERAMTAIPKSLKRKRSMFGQSSICISTAKVLIR